MIQEADRNRFTGSLRGKRVVLGVTASISIYRMPDLVRDLRREGADVHVGMSREAVALVSPKIMEWASGNHVVTELTGDIEHITLFSGESNNTVFLVSPCTHNMIGKMANGISDDVPSAFYSFASGNGNKVMIAPAMHEGMLRNQANERNLSFLKSVGVVIAPPEISEDKAKLSGSSQIIDMVCRMFNGSLLEGKKILIIGGHTEEAIDPVRSISNHSTGFTAYWLSRNAYRTGASKITYIGNSSFELPSYVDFSEALSSREIEQSTLKELNGKYDIVLSPAAISDYTVSEKHQSKLQGKEPMKIELIPRSKIIDIVRKHHKGVLVAFNLSDEPDQGKVRSKFASSNPEIVVCNPAANGKSFGEVLNDYTILTKDGEVKSANLSKPEMTLELLRLISKTKGA